MVNGRCLRVTAVSHPTNITITDNDAGIAPADLPHIFSRFYRTDQSRTRRTGGMGLGLAIARATVEAHGGEIVVMSKGVGRGTAVTFNLLLLKQR